MKKMTRLFACAGAMTLLSASAAFGGTWANDGGRWWYDNGDGTYAVNGWQWIDGNGDGIEECYYFDSEGWLITNSVTPDGYTIDENGAWVMNQEVQTRNVTGENTEVNVAYAGINGRYVDYAYKDAESMFEYDATVSGHRIYIEKQGDGSLKYVDEVWDEGFKNVVYMTERILEKIGENTYFHATENEQDECSIELQFTSDDTFTAILIDTMQIVPTVEAEIYYRKVLN